MKNGEKLRNLRNAFGLTQREFGDELGITRASVNSYENNFNPIPQGVKWKILQATGIGFEYFDTDMSLGEAFVKYKIDPQQLELRKLEENICSIYDGLKNFIDGTCIQSPFTIKSWILDNLFDMGRFDLCFIKIKYNELEPYAKNKEILAVIRDKNVENGDKIIIDFKGNVLVVQYFSEFDEVRLQIATSGKDIRLKNDEFKKSVKILAIIKGKYLFEL